MSETSAIVTAIDGDHAVVRTEEERCGRCHEQGGCGGANIGRMLCAAPKQWRVLNPRGAAVGERVRIAIADGAIRSSALLIYILPLGLLIAGAVLGSFLGDEPGAIAGSLLGLLVAWRVIVYRQAKRACDPRFHPHIL